MAQTDSGSAPASGAFQWGGRSWGPGDLAAFKRYLAAHGGNYATWATNHPTAAASFGGGQRTADPNNPVPPPATGVAPANLQSLIDNDPGYQQLKGMLGAQDVSDAASRKAAIDRALIAWGVVPAAGALQGLSPEDLAMLQGDIDPTTGQLAAKNTAEGLSMSARIAQLHADNLSQIKNSLAARGMLSSGSTGFETGREDLANKQASTDALSQLLDQIGGYINAYKGNAVTRAGQLSQGAAEAAQRVKDYLGATNPNPVPAPAAGSGAASAGTPALRTAIPTVPRPKPRILQHIYGMVE